MYTTATYLCTDLYKQVKGSDRVVNDKGVAVLTKIGSGKSCHGIAEELYVRIVLLCKYIWPHPLPLVGDHLFWETTFCWSLSKEELL